MSKILLFILLNTLIVYSRSQQKLIFIQELFRHGARYPIYPSPDDGSEYSVQLKSQGQLTTQGKNMHYLLGKRIYQKYWSDLFKNTPYESNYNQSKFYFKATDVNRTIESCQSHLMGIFQNTKTLQISEDEAKFSSPLWPNTQAEAGQVFTNARDFHPLPIHVEKSRSTSSSPGDFLRAYSGECCPNQDIWTIQNQNEAGAKQIRENENFTNAINEFNKVINKKESFQDIADHFDNYQTTLYLGRETLPIFSNPQYSRQFEYIYVLDLYINLFYTKHQLKTTSSRFFEHTIHNMKRAIKHKDVQWVVYSAHDTTVANMLAAMNLTNAACIYEAYLKGDNYNEDICISKYPGYTASIIFELWEDDITEQRVFKIRYKGELRKIPFCNYSMECSVERFKEWWQSEMYEPNFLSSCGIHDQDKGIYLAASIFEFGIILCFVLYFVVNHLKKKMVKEDERKSVIRTMLTQEVQSK